jgi:lysophospholipase L1-like esterase
MKVSTIFSVGIMIALVALGSALAQNPASSSNRYLALGDSVGFGFIEQAAYEYYNPTNFVAYPDYVSLAVNLNLSNASCPGETTGSFLSSTAPDAGCRFYRSMFPLHVIYTSAKSTQVAYGTTFLQRHTDTALVTIDLGANDLLLLEEACNNDPTCIEQGAPQLFAMVAANMATILGDLRATGYSGAIIIMNYYSLDYSNQFVTQLTEGLNQAISAPAGAYGAVVADVFSAFAAATSNPFAQGNTCVAGLLNASNPPTSPPSCDIHPSQSGHKLIAQTIAATYQSRRTEGSK